MKRYLHILLAICLALVFCGCALAQETESEGEILQAEMQLFTAGDVPMPVRMRSVVPEGFAEYVAQQLRSQAESIKVLSYALQPDAFLLALSDVINDNPDLFYIGASVKYTTGASSGNVYNYFPEYLYSGDDLQNRIAAYEASVAEIAAYAVGKSNHPIGQMMAVNDYFCIHYCYDDSLSIKSPDLLFSEKTGVCQAYMLAYSAVLDALGIPNTHATSYPMAHIWNLVQLEDQWYHIDVTWNDPSGYPLTSRYRYFLLSDDGMTAANHYGWTADYAAQNTAYDAYFWQDTFTPMGISGENLFYLSNDSANGMRTICRWNLASESSAALHSFSIADSSGSYISTTAYNPICVDSEKIYYAARGDMYRMNLDGSDAELIRLGDDSAYIWSCWMDGDTIRLLAGTTSMENTRTIAFPLNGSLVLPEGLKEIRSESFAASIVRKILLPEGLLTIGERAFANNALLETVNIPASVSSIADNAFEGSQNVTLQVISGSYGESYAREKGIACTSAS